MFDQSSEIESQLHISLGAALGALVIALSLTACGESHVDPRDEMLTRSRYLMGTPLTITVPDKEENLEAVDDAFDEVARVEALISTWRDDSAVAAINQAPVGTPSSAPEELITLLDDSLEWYRDTEGAFDPTAGRILFGWDLRGDGRVPSPAEIEEYRTQSGGEHLLVRPEEGTVTREVDLLIEEGGFGKGYALDRAARILRDAGIDSAMLDFGGQVTIWGDRPRSAGIADPTDRLEPAVEIEVTEGSIATSSGSERFFEAEGERYSHLLDPRTGHALPPRGSVTVIHESGLVSDILATALYVMGPEDGLRWADERSIKAIFVSPGADGTWHVKPSQEASRTIAIRPIDRDFIIERKL